MAGGGLRGALGANELTDRKSGLMRALVGEFLGTLLLNLFGCGAVATGNVVAIALSFGLTVAAAIQAVGHVSGGHVNPAVTCGLLVAGKIPVIRALLYIVLQSAGAIAGSAILRALSAESMEGSLGVLELQPGITAVQGLGIEFFAAMVLVLVVCGACDNGKPESRGVAPLVIGLTVTVGHIVAIPRTGCGMNPARALGSAVVMGRLEDHWVYWVGPILGGIAAALVYTQIIGHAKPSERSYATVATEDKELTHLKSRKDHQPA